MLQVLPEGIMIYKRFGNPHLKLWNKELESLFKFTALPSANMKNSHNDSTNHIVYDSETVEVIDDLDNNHLLDIL